MKTGMRNLLALAIVGLLAASSAFSQSPPFNRGPTQAGTLSVLKGGTGTTTSTGTGSVVLSNTPTLVTPVLGAATATSINFGGTSLATYAEGTFTPTIIGSSTAGTGQTYSTQQGIYTKIGRHLNASFQIVTTNKGTGTGTLQIMGLPFTCNGASFTGNYGGSLTYANGVTFPALMTTLTAVANTNVIYLIGVGSATATAFVQIDTHIANATTIQGSVACEV